MSLSLRTLVVGSISTLLLSSIGCGPTQTMNPWTLRHENTQLKAALRQYQDQLAQSKNRADNLDADNESLQTQLAERQRDETRFAQNTPREPVNDYRVDEEPGSGIGAPGRKNTGAKPAPASNRDFASAPNISGAQVVNEGNAVRIRVTNTTLFDPGKAKLKPGADKVLNQVASSVRRNYPNQLIGIEGHTDSDPIKKSGWHDNQDLSYQRARAVYDYLSSNGGIPANQLYIAAYGANHPIASNSSSSGKAQNRRVEFVVRPDEGVGRQ